eukprot:scaffold5276_cov124-Isochrysis_galbana.AAC.3
MELRRAMPRVGALDGLHHQRIQTSGVGYAAGPDSAGAQGTDHFGHVHADLTLHFAPWLQRQAAVQLLGLLARAHNSAGRPAQHLPLKEGERRVEACVRAVLPDALGQDVRKQHGVAQDLVRSLRFEGLRRRGRARRGCLCLWRPKDVWLQDLAIVDGIAGHVVKWGAPEQGRDWLVPPTTSSQDLRLERHRVLHQHSGSVFGAREGELPHGRVGGEGHGIDARGPVDRLEDAPLGQRDRAVHDAQDNHQADVVQAVARKPQLAPHRREDAVGSNQQRSIQGGALAVPSDRARPNLLHDPGAEHLARDVDEAPRVVALLPLLALAAEGLPKEAEDVALRREGVVRCGRRVVLCEVDPHRLNGVLPLDGQAVPLLAGVEAAISLQDEHVEALALQRDGHRRPADAAARHHDAATPGDVDRRTGEGGAGAFTSLAEAAHNLLLAGSDEGPFRVVERLFGELVEQLLRRARQRLEELCVELARVGKCPRQVGEIDRAQVGRAALRRPRQFAEERPIEPVAKLGLGKGPGDVGDVQGAQVVEPSRRDRLGHRREQRGVKLPELREGPCRVHQVLHVALAQAQLGRSGQRVEEPRILVARLRKSPGCIRNILRIEIGHAPHDGPRRRCEERGIAVACLGEGPQSIR